MLRPLLSGAQACRSIRTQPDQVSCVLGAIPHTHQLGTHVHHGFFREVGITVGVIQGTVCFCGNLNAARHGRYVCNALLHLGAQGSNLAGKISHGRYGSGHNVSSQVTNSHRKSSRKSLGQLECACQSTGSLIRIGHAFHTGLNLTDGLANLFSVCAVFRLLCIDRLP